jgi:gamma-glutamyltranspeptidase/glutathione hydrolase
LAGDIKLINESEHTTHFSVIDQDRMAVSLTYTLENSYGSRVVVPGAGFILNDEMNDFNWLPGVTDRTGRVGTPPNQIAPGKRMLSSMTPTFMESPDKVVALGAPGGSRIITEVLLGILGYDDGLSAQQVAALPRFHHQWLPDVISAEAGALSPATVTALRAMGHTVNAGEPTWGNLQTVAWDRRRDALEGGSDPRHPEGKADVLLQP